jgi:hypothetical protein
VEGCDCCCYNKCPGVSSSGVAASRSSLKRSKSMTRLSGKLATTPRQ